MRRCNGLLSRRVDLLAVLVLSTLGAAAASMAQSTTMGFTRQFHFPPGAGEDLHWISLP